MSNLLDKVLVVMLLLLGMSSIVYAGVCDSVCTGVMKASSYPCNDWAKYNTSEGRCLYDGQNVNCDKPADSEGECDCRCGHSNPPKPNENCFCKYGPY